MRSTRRSQIQVTGGRTESWGRRLDPEGAGDARDLTPPSFRQYQQTGPRMGKSERNVLETRDLSVVALAEGDNVVLAAGPDGRMLLGSVGEGRERFSMVHPEEDDIRLLTAPGCLGRGGVLTASTPHHFLEDDQLVAAALISASRVETHEE